MPELPEVETVRVQLWKKLKGKKIKTVEAFHPKSIRNDTSFSKKLKGEEIKSIDRVGKLMIFSFTNNKDLFMLAHLKMTGQFFVTDKKGKVVAGGGHTMSNVRTLPDRHTRIGIYFGDGARLYFNDMRLFGYLKLASKKEMEAAKSRFGPEPIKDDFDKESFFNGLGRKGGPIKAVLLDQTFIAGLGNIYVDEALFRAKVLPTRPAKSLTRKEALALAKHAGEVMIESIELGGTTFQHFADTEGEKGGFKDKLRVFGRQGQKCVRCKTVIKKSRVAGRGTHYCEHCQK